MQTVIAFNYNAELVDLVKSYDGREYNPDNRTWTIYNSDVDDFIAEAGKLGFKCTDRPSYDYRSSGNSNNSARPPRSSNGSSNSKWADNLFAAVGPDLVDKTYKVMSRVVHPDIGGNEELFKQLESAYSRIKGKVKN